VSNGGYHSLYQSPMVVGISESNMAVKL